MALISIDPIHPTKSSPARVLKVLRGLWPSRKRAERICRIDMDARALRDCGLSHRRVDDDFYRRFTDRCLR